MRFSRPFFLTISILFFCSTLFSCTNSIKSPQAITTNGSAADIPPVDIEMTLKKVSPHVYYAQGKAGIATDNKGFISNSAVIITDDGIIIFDALGTPSLAKKLLSKIREISDKPLKKIFISHYHADHFFGLQGLLSEVPKSGTVAEIYAPAGAKKYLAREGADVRLNERRKSLTPWVNKTTRLTEADHYLTKDMSFNFGGLDIDVKLFGSAHSDGDLTLYVKQEKVLISGDLLFTGRIPFIGGDNVMQWSEKIDELAKLPADWIIPGHGAVFTDFSSGSELTKSYLALLHKVMTEGVDELMSFDEIYNATDWSAFEHLPAFKTGNRINAYRVFLNAEKAALEKE